MLLLADIDFGELLLAMLAFFFLFLAIWLFIVLFGDIFGRTDLSGWAKAGWTLLIFILPLIGILIYLIARPPEPPGGRSTTAGAYQEPGASASRYTRPPT
jgi:Phospholipase_D-nuclease N-terminal